MDTTKANDPYNYPAWQSGDKGMRRRLIVLGVLLIEIIAILCGWTFQRRSLWMYLEGTFFIAALNIGFEIVSETWLDWARTKALRGKMIENSNIREPQLRRESFHRRNMDQGIIPGVPYLGPHNWHYETSACIRDVLLSLAMLILFLTDQLAFSDWWASIVLATYLSDLLFLLARWSFISTGWLHFVILHHIFSLLFLVATSWRPYATIYPPGLRAIALIWFSNQFTTFPIIYRSFTGVEKTWMVVSGVILQRIIRWGGVIWAFVQLLGYPNETYFIVEGTMAIILLESLDVPSQMRKVRSLLRNRKDEEQDETDDNIDSGV